MQTLTNRLRPYLRDGVSFDTMDGHTSQALEVFIFFRASSLADLPPDQIKAELARMPEAVRGLVRAKTRELWKARQSGY